MNDKHILYDRLRQHKYMALATASADGKPEVATVEYMVDGDSLLINTFVQYRKYQNLLQNGRVAGAVTAGHDWTLQFDAIASELHGGEAADAKQKLLTFDPSFTDYFSEENTRFFRIVPTWMRLRDYTKQPLQVVEYIP